MSERRSDFDFAAFKKAFEDKDFESWVSFHADDAEWIEYRHSHDSVMTSGEKGLSEYCKRRAASGRA